MSEDSAALLGGARSSKVARKSRRTYSGMWLKEGALQFVHGVEGKPLPIHHATSPLFILSTWKNSSEFSISYFDSVYKLFVN